MANENVEHLRHMRLWFIEGKWLEAVASIADLKHRMQDIEAVTKRAEERLDVLEGFIKNLADVTAQADEVA